MKLHYIFKLSIIFYYFIIIEMKKNIRVRYPVRNIKVTHSINDKIAMKKEKLIVQPNIPFLMKPLRYIKTTQLSSPNNFGFMYRREGVKYSPTNMAEVTGRLTRKASRSQLLKFDADGRHVIFNRPYGSKIS